MGKQRATKQDFPLLLQLRPLRFGFLQDGDVGVGVFPEGEEIFVDGERPEAGTAWHPLRARFLTATHWHEPFP